MLVLDLWHGVVVVAFIEAFLALYNLINVNVVNFLPLAGFVDCFAENKEAVVNHGQKLLKVGDNIQYLFNNNLQYYKIIIVTSELTIFF